MKNNHGFCLIFAFVVMVFCFTLSGCKNLTKVDELKENGNTIVVRYDANGGTYMNRQGITVIDMFNPADYSSTKDSSGTIHISLLDPSDKNRPSGTSDGIFITRTDYFLVGWYQNKELKKNDSGKVVNDNGEALVEIDGTYYLESDNSVSSDPAYTYSGYWDFSKDTIDFTSDMTEYEMTLYACWAKNFEFEYYAKTSGNWECIDSNKFNYMIATTEEAYSDYAKIWTPTWVDGALNYSFKYANGGNYTFPKVSGYTFKGAYLDENLTESIGTEYVHQGYIDFSTGEAINSVQKIYIDLDEGEYYHISSANQIIKNANLNGIYIIEDNLDFAGLEWPTTFSLGTFNGQFTTNGSTYCISNITVTHNSDTAKCGGIFGSLSSKAKISNITFDNATLDISYAGRRNRDTKFGLFTGNIETGAVINNVSLSGTIKFGPMSLGDNYSINLVANGETTNINVLSNIHVLVYGNASGSVYKFTIDPDDVIVNTDGDITLTFKSSIEKAQESYEIEYKDK